MSEEELLDEIGVTFEHRFKMYFYNYVQSGCPNPTSISCDRESIIGRAVHKWQAMGYIKIIAEAVKNKERASLGGIKEMYYEVELTETGILMLEIEAL